MVLSVYEVWIHRASHYERKGWIAKAIDALDNAEKLLSDGDELEMLKLWRERLRTRDAR